MHPDDRFWLLDQLSQSERKIIEELLSEINDLGLDADASIVESIFVELAQPLKESDESIAISGFVKLDPFWQHVLMSGIGESEFHKLINSHQLTSSALPLEAVPKKLQSFVYELTKSASL